MTRLTTARIPAQVGLSAPDETKDKLRLLRDRLASEAPRARAEPLTPPELLARLHSALQSVSGVYLLSGALGGSGPRSDMLTRTCESALIQGYLAVRDWERWLEQEERDRARTRTPSLAERRLYVRYETNVPVQLQREPTSRTARNLSLGGLFVAATREDVPQLDVGSALVVTVRCRSAPPMKVRAEVMRRDAAGLGLQWIQDSAQVERGIARLLDGIRESTTRR
jgi:PilZ domain